VVADFVLITAVALAVLAALGALCWWLLTTMDRGTWKVCPTSKGLDVWPSGYLVPETVAWSSLDRVTELSWCTSNGVKQAVLLHLRGTRRRIAVYRGTYGVDELRSGLQEFAGAVPYEVRFSYRRSLWVAVTAALLTANGIVHLLLGGVRQDWGTLLWSAQALVGGLWTVWTLAQIKRASLMVAQPAVAQASTSR
jgi:hypothetical protein